MQTLQHHVIEQFFIFGFIPVLLWCQHYHARPLNRFFETVHTKGTEKNSLTPEDKHFIAEGTVTRWEADNFNVIPLRQAVFRWPRTERWDLKGLA